MEKLILSFIILVSLFSFACNKSEEVSIKLYKKAIEIKLNLGKEYFDSARYQYKSKDYPTALLYYTKAIEINPNFADAYTERGIMYSNLLCSSESKMDLAKGLKLNNLETVYFDSATYYYNLKDYFSALLYYTKVIEINPNSAKTYCIRGITLHLLQDDSKSISDLTKSIEINPNYTDAYTSRGSVYYFLGNKIKACEDFRKSYSMGNTTIKDILDEICDETATPNDPAKKIAP